MNRHSLLFLAIPDIFLTILSFSSDLRDKINKSPSLDGVFRAAGIMVWVLCLQDMESWAL